MKYRGNEIKFFAIGAILALGVFVFDLFSPLGVAGGVPYVAIVLITLWISEEKHTYFAGIAGTLLTIAGFLLSPLAIAPMEVIYTNRLLAIFGMWVAVFVILKYKRSYKEMMRHKENLDALFLFATEGILITNQHGEIILINPKAEELFGYEKGALLGKTIETLVPERFRQKHVQHRKSYQQNPHSRSMGGSGMELFGRRKDNSEFPVEISLTHFKSNDGLFVIAFIIDISLRKEQEQLINKQLNELQIFSEKLKESNAELENFAYISSHDLQEPLRKVQSFGDRLKSIEGKNFSEQGRDYLERILNASQRMQRLINDLLMFSRLTTRTQQFTEVDLNTLLNEVLSDMEITIEKNNAKIYSEKLPVIKAEPTQMRQLFQNLIGNAIKFKKEEIAPAVKIYSQKKNGKEELYFEDNGIGFDEKYNDRIFNIFQRLEGQKYDGSGIGLAVCKKIASRHGGSITAKSKQGEGTTFIVTLPNNLN